MIKDILDQIQGAMWFTKIDLRNAFNQIRIKEEDEWKTAFRTRYRTFEYQVFPFGLSNASAIFQRYINMIFRKELDQEGIDYINDILITGKTIEDYRSKIR